MNLKIHHIGYMIKKMNSSIEEFERIGFTKETITYDEIRKAEICFMNKDGYCIELVSPSKESDLYELMKKCKNMAYHICYLVDNLNESVKIFEESGYFLFKEEEAAPAIGQDARVVFLINQDVGIVELLQLQ